MYLSTNQQGEPDVVTGTVIVPKAAWSGSGSAPGRELRGGHAGPRTEVRAVDPDGGRHRVRRWRGHRRAAQGLRSRDHRLPGVHDGLRTNLHRRQVRGPRGPRHRPRGPADPGLGRELERADDHLGLLPGRPGGELGGELQPSYAPEIEARGRRRRRRSLEPPGGRRIRQRLGRHGLRARRARRAERRLPDRIQPRLVQQRSGSRGGGEAAQRVRDPVARGIPRREPQRSTRSATRRSRRSRPNTR